ncbi:hypothetical protein NDU88_000634 [Pleurodeles waltl]|uniref:Uncharacterized protein n=1 Tax=Pleurodeles waltl TaxID=8319 RepID=A0AAV7MIM4_PLEWA|nr:hypothetical protein NDU88_000634 [Pleurodeles waltl]
MQQSIAPPPPFVPNPASPDADWEQRKEAFEAYLDALEGETFTHKRKFAILRHCLGNEGRKILKYVPKVSVITDVGEGDGVEDEYETAIKSLDTRFKRCRNVTLERHQFYKRVQVDGESASSYVGALRLLAVLCDYKEFEEEMIKDQLVEKNNDKKKPVAPEWFRARLYGRVLSSHALRFSTRANRKRELARLGAVEASLSRAANHRFLPAISSGWHVQAFDRSERS